MISEAESFDRITDPVNLVPFESLSTQFSDAVIARDSAAIHLVEIEAQRQKILLERALTEYDNMIMECKKEMSQLSGLGGNDGEH